MPKKPLKTERVSLSEIFPWLKKETDKEYKARMKKRDALRKKHPRANSKAWVREYCYPDSISYEGDDMIATNFLTFIDSADLDKVQRKAYEKWLIGQTRPVIPGVESASYFSDYHRFYEAFIEGRIATIND